MNPLNPHKEKEILMKQTESRKKKFLSELNKKNKITNNQLDKLLLKYKLTYCDVVKEMVLDWEAIDCVNGKINFRRIK